MKLLTFFSIVCISFSFGHSLVFAQNYESEQISVIPFQKSISRTGKVAFKRTLKLSFKSSGYLAQLSVDEGDYFDQNKLLATLNTKELRAEKNIRYIYLLQAKRDVNRIKKLIDKKLASQQDLDLVQTTLDSARESYKVAYYNLEKAEMYAPFEGVVLARYSELGELQSPGKEVLKIAAIEDNLIVKVRLTDTEISLIKRGQTVKVNTLSLGALNGVISKIPVQSNTDGNLYLIEVLLEKIKVNQKIVADQLAQVNIDFSTDEYVYKVPINALIETDTLGQAIVLIKSANNKFHRQTFNVMNIDNQYIYLQALNHSNDLEIVTQGWHQIDESVR